MCRVRMRGVLPPLVCVPLQCSVLAQWLYMLLPNFSLLCFGGKYSHILGWNNHRIRLGGLICSLKSFLQLNMCQELHIFFQLYIYIYIYVYIYVYVLGCKLSLVRFCDSDFGITPIDDVTIGITCAAFCFLIAHISFAISCYLFCLSVIVLARLCVLGAAISIKKVFFGFLFIKVMSGQLKCIVLSISMLRFQ